MSIVNLLCFYPEAIDRFLCINLSGFKRYGWEVGVIRTVGEMLCFEADSTTFGKRGAVLSFRAASIIICVELESGFSRVDLHCAAANRLFHLRSIG